MPPSRTPCVPDHPICTPEDWVARLADVARAHYARDGELVEVAFALLGLREGRPDMLTFSPRGAATDDPLAVVLELLADPQAGRATRGEPVPAQTPVAACVLFESQDHLVCVGRTATRLWLTAAPVRGRSVGPFGPPQVDGEDGVLLTGRVVEVVRALPIAPDVASAN